MEVLNPDDDDIMNEQKELLMNDYQQNFYVNAMSLLHKLTDFIQLESDADVTAWTSLLRFLSRYLCSKEFTGHVCSK